MRQDTSQLDQISEYARLQRNPRPRPRSQPLG